MFYLLVCKCVMCMSRCACRAAYGGGQKILEPSIFMGSGEESDGHARMLDHLARPPDGGRTTPLPAHRLSMPSLTKENSLDNAYLSLLPGHVLLPCSRIPPLPPPPPTPRILTTWLTCFPSILGLLHRLVPMPKGFFHIPLAFGCQFKSLCLKDTSPKPQTCCAKCG